MSDYGTLPSMKQGSCSYAPSIKKEKGALFRNSQLNNTFIKEKGPHKMVPTQYTLLRRREPLMETPNSTTHY